MVAGGRCVVKAKPARPYGESAPQKTYWNFEPVKARRVKVRVGKPLRPGWWCAKFEGTVRRAVEIMPDRPSQVLENPDDNNGGSFFIDDEDGGGWLKVTKGMGSPGHSHYSLPNDSVVVEVLV